MEIKWTPSAIARLQAIGDFIAQDAPERAMVFEDRLLESVLRLKEFPLSGPHVPENRSFRQIVLQGYRVIYNITPNIIEIVTIISPGLDGERALQNVLTFNLKKKKKR